MRTFFRYFLIGMILALVFTACYGAEVYPRITKSSVCSAGYSSRVRHVTYQQKALAYKQAGLKQGVGKCKMGCIVDHKMPIELGGTNDQDNLQIQTVEDSRAKDRVENFLHREVCVGHMTLKQAQKAMPKWRSMKVS